MIEFIYILENTLMPGLVKFGRTERSVSERVNELSSSTGVPTGFTVVKGYAVDNSAEANGTKRRRQAGPTATAKISLGWTNGANGG